MRLPPSYSYGDGNTHVRPGAGAGSPRDRYFQSNDPMGPNIHGRPFCAPKKTSCKVGLATCPALPLPCFALIPASCCINDLEVRKKAYGTSSGLNPKRNRFGGLAASNGVGWERRKQEPSTIRLQRPIVILRCTSIDTVAKIYFPLCAILRQILNPKPKPQPAFASSSASSRVDSDDHGLSLS